MSSSLKSTLALLVLAPIVPLVHAQLLPDASALYPELQPRLAPPEHSPAFRLDGGPLERSAQPGGAQFPLQAVRFQGNTAVSSERLQAQVQPFIGQSVDLAGLQDLANRLSAYYRAAGFPFARVYLPPQEVASGTVVMEVSEGRFGEVAATIDSAEGKQASLAAQAYLSAFKRGEVMAGPEIERVALIMNDLPGYTAVPIVRPGEKAGEGDLEMRLVEEERLRAVLGTDNHGSRYTGLHRVRADVVRSRNFVFGDEVRFTALATDGRTGMVHAAYGLPVSPNGLRLDLSAVHSTYSLSGDWLTGTGFGGKADILGAQLSYPQIRSQTLNLSFSGGLQHKRYRNEIGQLERYTVNALPLSMHFDVRDQFNGGAVTYGTLTAQHARVTQDNLINAGRDKQFSKLNVDLARAQRLTERMQASVRTSGQYTRDNVDSTEFMSISGPGAVRAFPIGEFSGHRGWFVQGEVSYSLPAYHLTPYLFYDRGQAINTTTTQRRSLSGLGVGARYAHAGWAVDLVAAWPKAGKPSQVEPNADGARVWISASKRF